MSETAKRANSHRRSSLPAERQPIRSPSGEFQMHFYYNSMTRKANYNIDYKAVFNK